MDHPPTTPKPIGFVEFVTIMALCMSVVALSIDTMLPALPQIGASFGVERPNSQQYIITFLFSGLSLGMLIAGPLSDSIGRKKSIYLGLSLFICGCLLSYFAPSFEIMLAGRFLQGIGASMPRVITTAIVRDRYEGRRMAQVMSYIMSVFILLPALAPSIGLGIMMLAGWHAIFLMFIVISVILFVWIYLRLPETLRPEDRRAFTLPVIWQGTKAVCSNKTTACYMIAAGFIFGAFIGYLNTSQQIFQGYYDSGAMFPIYFGVIALSLGAAFFANGALVNKYGMRLIILCALVALATLSAIFCAYELIITTTVPLPVFLTYIMASAFCMGMLFGNFNALAMVPMGHMAGIASAVIGCVSLLISIAAGALIGQSYDGTLMPVSLGFLLLSLSSLAMTYIAEKKPEA